MNFKQMQYVLAIAEESSFSKAAQKLLVSQPSLSQYIQRLEEELHVELFDRKSIPLRLTYAGEIYCKAAKDFLLAQERLSVQLNDVIDAKKGRISIGISAYRTTYLLPPAICEFRKQYPDIEIKLHEYNNIEIEKRLVSGEVDIGIVVLPMRTDQLMHKVLYKEDIMLALPEQEIEGVDLSAVRQRAGQGIAFAKLKDVPFIALYSNHRLNNLLLELCAEAGFEPKITLYCRNIESVRSMVMSGVGASILPVNPYIYLHAPKHPCYYTIKEVDLSREIAITYKKNRYMSTATKAFVSIFRATLKNRKSQADCMA